MNRSSLINNARISILGMQTKYKDNNILPVEAYVEASMLTILRPR